MRITNQPTDKRGTAIRTKIGIVTGGGDCPGLNAVIRAVVKAATRHNWETLGFLGGYDGMLEPLRYRRLDYRDVGGLLQRGGGPTNFDRALCTLFGTTSVELIAARQFGHMVTYTGAQVSSVPLADAIGHLRRVPLDSGFLRAARALGICLGD